MANLMEVLATIPSTIAIGWTAWFLAGGVLAFWYRRASQLEFAPALPATPRPVSRPKSAVRPPSSPSRSAVAPVQEAPIENAYEPPPGVAPVAAREKKPVVIGDPFGDLATLLDQPQSNASANRSPNDSPILGSAGSPIRRANDDTNLG